MEAVPPSEAFLMAGKAKNAGKPLETVGRKARGCGVESTLCSFGCTYGKPPETAGQQSQRLRGSVRSMLVRLPDTLRPKDWQRKDENNMKKGNLIKRGFSWFIVMIMCFSQPISALAADEIPIVAKEAGAQEQEKFSENEAGPAESDIFDNSESSEEAETSTEPETSFKPETSAEPAAPSAPETSAAPDTTEEPVNPAAPDTTEEPVNPAEPDTTEEPVNPAEPDTTAEPDASTAPDTTEEPDASTAPDTTAEPDATAEPVTPAEPVIPVEPEVTEELETPIEPETLVVEVPDEVKAFLEAVSNIPEINGDNLEEAGNLINAAIDAYERLIDAGLTDFEGVEAAYAQTESAFLAVTKAWGQDSATFETKPIPGTGFEGTTGHGVTIDPSGNSSDGYIGSNGNLTNNGGTITKKVGDDGFFLRLPTNTIVGQSCGHVVAQYTPDNYAVINANLENENGNVSVELTGYSVAEKFDSKNPYPCMQTNFQAVRPGITTVEIEYYVNYHVQHESGYCSCG